MCEAKKTNKTLLNVGLGPKHGYVAPFHTFLWQCSLPHYLSCITHILTSIAITHILTSIAICLLLTEKESRISRCLCKEWVLQMHQLKLSYFYPCLCVVVKHQLYKTVFQIRFLK